MTQTHLYTHGDRAGGKTYLATLLARDRLKSGKAVTFAVGNHATADRMRREILYDFDQKYHTNLLMCVPGEDIRKRACDKRVDTAIADEVKMFGSSYSQRSALADWWTNQWLMLDRPYVEVGGLRVVAPESRYLISYFSFGDCP